MKETILDVLMYLFENYIDEDNPVGTDEASLKQALNHAGFQAGEIDKAFEWLEGLAERQEVLSAHSGLKKNTVPMRIYVAEEIAKLDIECRGFLLFLEQTGVLDAANRELVIDRVMALEEGEISLDQLKWVILMVLFNQPEQDLSFSWVEDLVYDEAINQLH